MAGSARYTALLDACVLFPPVVADALISLHVAGLYTAVLAPLGLEAIHPDDFIVCQFDLDPYAALAAFKNMRARLRNPPSTAEAFTTTVERNQLVSTALRLREAIDLL